MVTLLNSCIIICFFSFMLSRKQAKVEGISATILKHPLITLIFIYCIWVIVILMTANRVGFDASNFKFIYDYVCRMGENPWDYTYEAFARLIIAFSNFFPGCSYFEFHAIILGCLFFLLYCYYDKIAYSFLSVFFLYLISGVYASDGMQFKNFISACLLSCALNYLTDVGKKNVTLYFILLLFATLLHFSFVIYFLLPLILTDRYHKVKKFLPSIGILLYSILFLGGQTLTSSIIMQLSRLPMMSKLSRYSGILVGRKSIVPVVIYLLVLVALYFCKQEKNFLSEIRVKFINVIWNVWLMMGIYLPALVYINAVYRIYRNLYIPIFVVLSNCVVSMPRLCKKRMLYSFIFIVLAVLLYIYPLMLGQAVDVYDPIIEGEYFWID